MNEKLILLAERCEAAAAPDRELDAEAWAAHNGVRLEWRGSTVYVADSLARPDMWFLFASIDPGEKHRHFSLYSEYEGRVPRCTASLDAAAGLIPSGWGWSLDSIGLAKACPDHDGTGPLIETRAATPALALTAASLRARAAQVQQ